VASLSGLESASSIAADLDAMSVVVDVDKNAYLWALKQNLEQLSMNDVQEDHAVNMFNAIIKTISSKDTNNSLFCTIC
jgi:hypothetical protein